VSRKLNWEKARQEDRARRAAEFHEEKGRRLPSTLIPPTPGQQRYLRVLAGKLGRDVPEVTSRSAARSEITKLKNILAVTRK
jgi:hypothetical protein